MLVLEDIGGEGAFTAPANRGRFYRNAVLDAWYRPGTFVFRYMKWPIPRLRRNALWHPVKTFPDTARDTYWRVLGLAGKSWRRLRGDLPVVPTTGPHSLDFAAESDDHLDYRAANDPDGPLSTFGEHVLCSLLRSGMSDEGVAARMSLGVEVVAERRRRWGRAYGETG